MKAVARGGATARPDLSGSSSLTPVRASRWDCRRFVIEGARDGEGSAPDAAVGAAISPIAARLTGRRR
jgi:hypothetical protein